MIQIQLQGVEEALKVLNSSRVRNIAKTSIRRAANSGKTIISAQIRERFNIQKKDVDEKLSVDLRNLGNLQVILTVHNQPISLTHFEPRSVRGKTQLAVKRNKIYGWGIMGRQLSRASAQGVFAKVVRGKVTQLPHAFIAAGKGGGVQVFQRKGKDRLPLIARKVIGYASIVKKPENLNAVTARIQEQLAKEFASRVKFFAEGGGGE
ncbi:MAG: phage tail protein [Candidatus Eisenbacteria bacterium]|nr:phage tail protein [Candidatus Eisenbacteria bacterium]